MDDLRHNHFVFSQNAKQSVRAYSVSGGRGLVLRPPPHSPNILAITKNEP
jgi:tRNA G37 N-methylase TrmD